MGRLRGFLEEGTELLNLGNHRTKRGIINHLLDGAAAFERLEEEFFG